MLPSGVTGAASAIKGAGGTIPGMAATAGRHAALTGVESEGAGTKGTCSCVQIAAPATGVGRSDDVVETVTIVVCDVGLPAAKAGVMPRAWCEWAERV